MQLKLLSFFLGAILLLSMGTGAYAQTSRLSGKVTSRSTGESLPGATVLIKGTKIGTMTDGNGNYSLSVPQSGATIVVSYIEMVTLEKVAAPGSTVLNFALDDANSSLNEVVVMGYGTQKITKVSGAISLLKSANIEKLNPVRTEDALQGQVSGVTVVQNGSPGAKPTLMIRGIPSYSGTDPTVIIDGVPQTLTDFNAINPADIESVNILKDAATSSIYGVKGGNGVIVVTTKTGKKNQKTEFSFSTNYGIQEVAKSIGVLNATEYGAMLNEGSVSSGGNVIFPDLSVLGVGTDWQKEIFHTAPLQTHNISAKGGSESVSYFLSAGYTSQAGVVGGIDKSRFDRGNFTANLSFDLMPKLKFILNATDVILNSKGVQENSFNSIIGSALNFDPTVPVYNDNPNVVSHYGYSNLIVSEIFNPLTKLENTYNKNIGNKLYGKFELQYDVLKNLKLSSRFGYTKYDSNAKTFTPLVFYGPLNVENSLDAAGNPLEDRHNQVSHDKVSNFNYTWETFANYDFKIKKDHTFETVIGFSLAKNSGNAANATRQDVPFNSWEFADFSAATGSNSATNSNASSGSYSQYFRRNLSYFGRLNYDYQSKYLASFTARRDGSFAFGTNNKYGNFFSGSLGWMLSSESFFHSSVVDNLKIRGSYGSLGNENVDPQFVKIITGGPSYGSTGNSNGYNYDDIFYPGSTVATAANKNLRWERQLQLNMGFDIALLKNKVTLTADYFEKKVNGLLFTPTESLYLGTVELPIANIGSTKSSGVDLSLGYNETVGNDFKINNTFNFTSSKNRVTETNSDGSAKIPGGYYFNGQSQSVTVFQKGYTPGYFYGYKTDGLFQNTDEIAAAATQQGARPGDIRYVDSNGDGKISADDQVQIGDPFPDFTLGWNLGLTYKNFDFSALTFASHGNDIYRAYERNMNFSNKFRSVLGRWTGPGTTNDATEPRYSFTDDNSNIRVSDRYVEDGSYIKIKNIQLGYTFSKSLLKNVFRSVRIYVQVRNLYTFTKYTGYDPEISGGILDTGIDRGAYPQARTYSAGLDIKL